MGSDRKDKKRALQWIEDASKLWREPLSAEEISEHLNANTKLMFGTLVVERLCSILVSSGKLSLKDGSYIRTQRLRVSESVDEEFRNLGEATE